MVTTVNGVHSVIDRAKTTVMASVSMAVRPKKIALEPGTPSHETAADPAARKNVSLSDMALGLLLVLDRSAQGTKIHKAVIYSVIFRRQVD
jgi:hypothetical protein